MNDKDRKLKIENLDEEMSDEDLVEVKGGSYSTKDIEAGLTHDPLCDEWENKLQGTGGDDAMDLDSFSSEGDSSQVKRSRFLKY